MASESSEHVKIHCACGAALKVPPAAIGKKIKCPKCDTTFVAEEEESPFALAPLDTYDEELLRKPEPPKPARQASAAAPPAASNQPSTPCPLCGKPITVGSVVCVACGYDARTGRRIGAAKGSVATAKRLAKGAGTFLLGCVLSGVGALVGAGIWLAIALITKYEIGWIAWGLGFLAGAGMVVGYRQHNVRAGIAAACIALGGILLSKLAIFGFVLYVVATGDTDDIEMLRYHVTDRLAEEELDKKGVFDPKDREKQWEVVWNQTEARVNKMKDEDIRVRAEAYRSDEEFEGQRDSEDGQIRSRIAQHEANLEAEEKGLAWNDAQRDSLLDRHERKLRNVAGPALMERKQQLDAWEKEGRWSDEKYVRNHLAYALIEEDLRAEPPASLADVIDLDVEEWEVPPDVWKTKRKDALAEVDDMKPEERVVELKKIEQERTNEEIRARLTYHRTDVQANREGISPYESREKIVEQHKKAVQSLSAEDLAVEAAKLKEWEDGGKWSDAPYLRDRLIYAHAEQEIDALRAARPKDAESIFWFPSEDEWKTIYAKQAAKVDGIPPDQHAARLRELEALMQRQMQERFAGSPEGGPVSIVAILAAGLMAMLSPIDILFVLLALTTAFQIGKRGLSKTQASG